MTFDDITTQLTANPVALPVWQAGGVNTLSTLDSLQATVHGVFWTNANQIVLDFTLPTRPGETFICIMQSEPTIDGMAFAGREWRKVMVDNPEGERIYF